MDIVHHAVIGLIGLNSAESIDYLTEGIFFLAGSILPDLDAFLAIFGKRFYLKNHQSFSHSLILIPIISLIITSLLMGLIDFSWANFFALSLGMCIHVLLDYTNTYGIRLFYPFNKNRISLDSIFFIDTFLLCLSLTTLLFELNFIYYTIIFLHYIIFKILLHKHVHRKLHADYTIPSAINPFSFYIYKDYTSTIITYEYNILTNTIKNMKKQQNIDTDYKHLTKQSTIYNDVKKIAKALHITKVTSDVNSTTLIAKDLALRNFGGKFATTTLTFNSDGKLLNETSNI